MGQNPKLKMDSDCQEELRLQDLYNHHILDTPDEVQFDQITKMASMIFQMPVALVNLVDQNRLWIKSKVGYPNSQIAREKTFCHVAIQENRVLVVSDATQDSRFSDSPSVSRENGIRFYAGAPLMSRNSQLLGTICVMDFQPRVLTETQIQILDLLSRQVVDQMELRRASQQIVLQNKDLIATRQELESNAEFFRQVMDTLPVALICKDATNGFRIKIWNKAAEASMGFSQSEAIGKTDHDLFPKHEADFFLQKDREALSNPKGVLIEEEEAQSPVLGKRFLRTQKVSLNNSEGKPQFVVAVIEDKTERKDYEVRMLQSSKMSSLGEMAAGIAHEINNPLGIIRGKAQLMKESIDLNQITPEKLLKWASTIDETTVRISKIISGLRNFAREGSQDPFRPTSIKEIMENVSELCFHHLQRMGIQIEVRGLESPLMIDCRSVQIIQVLVNLLSNASDAAMKSDSKWIRIEVQDLGAYAQIAVMDSGPGIPKDLRGRIMQPFFTTKEVGKGTGLGLSISMGLVGSHQGSLFLDSKQQNTCFVIQLPKFQVIAQSA